MKFSTISLFPEIIRASTEQSIAAKALDKGLFSIEHFQIRNHAVNDYGQVDDALYGGGTGMLLMAEPIYQTIQEARLSFQEKFANKIVNPLEKVIYFSPRGKVLKQRTAQDYLSYDHLILISGHYEGIDQRVIEELNAEEVSIGDYVLSGGELATAVFIDVVMRMIPGVLPSEDAWQNESHSSLGLLEADQYTRPSEWRGRKVPEVLLSGHAAKIEQFRRISSLVNTLESRPDLLAKSDVSAENWQHILQSMEDL